MDHYFMSTLLTILQAERRRSSIVAQGGIEKVNGNDESDHDGEKKEIV
jgi:hypothetical protein